MSGRAEARIVLVTGASSGIGAATADVFARAGWRVFGTSRRARPSRDGIEMLPLDVRSDESVDDCAAQVMARAGRIDVLVNNAGIMHTGMAEETSLDEARALFETNLFGVVRMTNAVLPQMRVRRHGRIVNVGSAAAWVGEPGEAFYAASKQSLAGYTEALRHEVWPLGITVSLVEPGAFATDIVASASTSAGRITDYDPVRRAAVRTLQESLRRGGDPHKVADRIMEVAAARSPRLRYPVGPAARWLPLLRVLLPQRLFDHLLRRGYGLREQAAPRAR
ncbi:SDR family NAD(P)-dependent oxidoreductase [Plantactinospora sp. B6F1]|uniref:SDR family NAD(P)-dependent oxidoreductase n=1 Tax=Plantactinospora sp. B6F1 TaxID=3158971 RepID=UPI0032D9A914